MHFLKKNLSSIILGCVLGLIISCIAINNRSECNYYIEEPTTECITPSEPLTEPITEPITEEPTTSAVRIVTTEEYLLRLRVCMSECGGRYGESLEGKIAVIETVLNRVDMGYGSIKEVITAKNQYSIADNGIPDETVVEAVNMALQGNMYPDNMIYFRTKYYHNFGTPYKQIGSHFFSLKGV